MKNNSCLGWKIVPAALLLLAFPCLGAAQENQPDAGSGAGEQYPDDRPSVAEEFVETAGFEDEDLELLTLDEEAQSGGSSGYGELSEDGIVLDRLEARQAFWDYFDNSDYQQAIDAGEVMVELTEQEFGPEHIELAPLLNGLGAAMARAGRPNEAVPHFERSISIYQDQSGIFSSELIDPMMGLGLALQNMGEHDLALGSFQRAQHLTHRHHGVNNLDQISMIQARANSYMAQSRWQEAETLQLLSFKLYRRNYGQGNVETIPAMMRLARWYQSILDYRQARMVYRQILELLDEKNEGDSPAMIPVLRGLASAYQEEHTTQLGRGLKAHERIVKIIKADPNFDLRDRILAHLELGDWYVMFNSEDKAWEQYLIAWNLSVENQDLLEGDWLAIFDRPHVIYPGQALSVNIMGYGVVGKEVYYDFQFNIGRDGRPEDINIMGGNLHGQTRSAAIHAFRFARFRPRMVDGLTVETTGYTVRRIYPTAAPENFATVKVGEGY